MKARKSYFIAVLFLLFVMSTGAVFAQKVDITKSDKVPRYDTLTEEQFAAQSDLYKEKPYGDKYLEYKIRLPKGWRKGSEEWQGIGNEDEEREKERNKQETLGTAKENVATAAMNQRVLGKLRRYFGANRIGTLSYLEVSALELDFDVSARNWFINYILNHGYTLEAMEEISAKRVEALYIVFDKDTSYVVRTVAEINGSRIVLVSYYLPETNWNEERAFQEKVITSFRFISPEDKKIEATRTYSFLEMLRFDYPVSWKLLAPNINTVDSMEVRLINKDKHEDMNGEIHFHVISTELDTTLTQEVGYIRDDIVDIGFRIGDMIGVINSYKFNDYLFFNRVEVYEASPKKGSGLRDHELWLAVMAEDRYYYIITMLSPSRDDDFYNWSRNVSALKIVLESIRP